MGDFYIDAVKLEDFSENIDLDLIMDDLSDVYKIGNILDDGESLWIIANTLLQDYESKKVNYKGYICKNMDARFMMEIRKSMLLLLCPELKKDLYKKTMLCKTIEEIKEVRVGIMSRIIKEYKDYDWQVYYVLLDMWGIKGKDLEIDFESCYNDGNYLNEKTPKDYRDDFIVAHFNANYRDEVY